MNVGRTETFKLRAMCGVHFNGAKDLIPLLGFQETICQLAMEKGVHWYCHVLIGEDGHVL